jgi:cytochrome P450
MGALKADPSLIDSAIEESIRLDTPLTQFAKLSLVDCEIADFQIPAGEILSLSLPSANRDESRYGSDSAEFVVNRFAGTNPDHLGFGVGIHLCVGAYLARRTARQALRFLIELGIPLQLAPGYRYEKVAYYEFRRPRSLDVTLAPPA